MEGLFGAGDCVQAGGAVTGSIGTGFITAENAAKYAGQADMPVIDEDQVRSLKERVFAPYKVNDVAEPMEFETKIRMITERYTGIFRSAGKLKEGLTRLADVRRDWLHRIAATTPHELMRAMDCHNLIDLAEVHFKSALMREDTRASFYRKDFPQRNPAWDKKVIYSYEKEGETVTEKGEFPEIKPDYAEESN